MDLTRIATAMVRIRKSQVGLGDPSGCSPAAGDDLEPPGSSYKKGIEQKKLPNQKQDILLYLIKNPGVGMFQHIKRQKQKLSREITHIFLFLHLSLCPVTNQDGK